MLARNFLIFFKISFMCTVFINPIFAMDFSKTKNHKASRRAAPPPMPGPQFGQMPFLATPMPGQRFAEGQMPQVPPHLQQQHFGQMPGGFRPGNFQDPRLFQAHRTQVHSHPQNSNFGQAPMPQLPINSQVMSMGSMIQNRFSPPEQPQKDKETLEQRKKILREEILNFDAPIIFYLPHAHQLEYLPQLHLGKHSSSSSDFTVDPFTIKISVSLDFVVSNLKQVIENSLKIWLCDQDKRKLFDYQREKIKIDVNIPRQVDGKYVYDIFLDNQKEQIIKMASTKAAKAVNGRSDGMKTNVHEFKKKMRTLKVSFSLPQRQPIELSTTIIACSSSSFQIALRPYRDEIEKIKEFHNFLKSFMLEAKAETPKISQNIPTTVSNRNNTINNQIDIISEVRKNPQHILSLSPNWASFSQEKQKIVLDNFKTIEEALLEEVRSNKLSSDYVNSCLRHLFGSTFAIENIIGICSSEYFEGVVKDALHFQNNLRLDTKLNPFKYPDGCAKIIISKLPESLVNEQGAKNHAYHWMKVEIPGGYSTSDFAFDASYYAQASLKIMVLKNDVPLTFVEAADEFNLLLSMPIFSYTPDNNPATFRAAKTLEKIEAEWRAFDVIPGGKIEAQPETRGDEFSREARLRLLPVYDFNFRNDYENLADKIYDDKFSYPMPTDIKNIESILQEWNLIEQTIANGDTEMGENL